MPPNRGNGYFGEIKERRVSNSPIKHFPEGIRPLGNRILAFLLAFPLLEELVGDVHRGQKSHLESKRLEMESAISTFNKFEKQSGLYSAQIELAKKEKKDGFDSDKYAIKRLCI